METVQYSSNKARNIMGYVFSGIGLGCAVLAILFYQIFKLIEFDNPAILVLFGFILLGGLLSFGSALASVIVYTLSTIFLATCIKNTEPKRRIINIIILVLNGIIMIIFIAIFIYLFIEIAKSNNAVAQ